MSHYTVKFGDMPEELQAIEALKEIIGYMGKESFAKHSAMARIDIAKGLTLSQFQFVVSIAGVQGFPARVWYNYCKYDLRAEGA
jgi:hypothetical protein